MLQSTACPAATFNDALCSYWASAVSARHFVVNRSDTMLPSVRIRVDVFRNFMVNATVNAAASVVERYHSWENTQVCRNTPLCISPFEDSGFPTQTEA